VTTHAVRPRQKATANSLPSAPRVNVVYGAACPNCGHRRRTQFHGLPADVATMLRAALDVSGLTKAELTRRIGINSSSYVPKLLAGTARPSRPVARDLIAALNLPWCEGEQLLAASGSERDRRAHRDAA
jgi:ribosome-binding protein aMBF1 (putative translation factor)